MAKKTIKIIHKPTGDIYNGVIHTRQPDGYETVIVKMKAGNEVFMPRYALTHKACNFKEQL